MKHSCVTVTAIALALGIVFFVGCNGRQEGDNVEEKIVDSLTDDGDGDRYDDFYWLVDSTQLSFGDFTVNERENARITVTNNTDFAYPLTLAAYEMHGYQLSDQKFYAEDRQVVSPRSQVTLDANLPGCMATINLYSGNAPDTLYNDNRSANRLIGWTYQLNENDTPDENDIFDGDPNLDNFPDDDSDWFDEGFAGVGRIPEDDDDGDRDVGPANNLCGR